MRKIATLILCFIVSHCAFSQKEAANWYFGFNAGIRFNDNGTVTELTDGQLKTIEGCTTISDANGNLLFYTDGITIWDRSHKVMPNANVGSGGLYGNPSSSQSAIVIPKPKDPNIYYIFTVDTFGEDLDRGFNYSVIDMTLNGGFGDVTIKNRNLLSKSSEKISAVVKDCKSQSLWVITLGPEVGLLKDPIIYNTFYAYEITETGIKTTPVTSSFTGLDIQDARGYLKLSSDGTKLACANAVSGLYLYDFDTNTGTVSNQKEIVINFSPINRPQSSYGVEFSQNGDILYVSTFFNPNEEQFNDPNVQHSALLQYDLTATNISLSEVVVDNRRMFRGALQLGIDGKIYRAMSTTYLEGTPYLSVINNPNVLGPGCNYQNNAIRLTNNSRQGLPPFIASFFAEKIDIIGNNAASNRLDLCDGDTYTLRAIDAPGALYSWYLDGNLLPETDFDLDISSPGSYRVFVDLNTGDCGETFEGIATIVYNTNPIANDAELVQCDEDGILGGFTRFDLTQANNDLTGGVPELSTKFFSDSGRTNKIPDSSNYAYNADAPSPIYVEVYNVNTNCYDTSVLTLSLSLENIAPYVYRGCDEIGSEDGINTFNLEDITTNIKAINSFNYPITYYGSYEDALLEKNALETSHTNDNSPYRQIIYARVENANTCFGIIEVTLIVNELPDISTQGLIFNYCLNTFPETININPGISNDVSSNYTYSWSTGDHTYTIQINEAKDYTVTITNTNGCSKEKVIKVEPSNIATIQEVKIKDVSSNNTITVIVSGEGDYEYRLLNENNEVIADYQKSHIFDNVFPGIYHINVKDIKNDCGTRSAKAYVIGFPRFFTPNNDGINDTWQIYGISNEHQPHTKIRIFNRYGKLVKQIDPIGKGWDGTINGDKLPVDDYWFVVKLQDGSVFKDHFTLKY